jgi:hypothetical protein
VRSSLLSSLCGIFRQDAPVGVKPHLIKVIDEPLEPLARVAALPGNRYFYGGAWHIQSETYQFPFGRLLCDPVTFKDSNRCISHCLKRFINIPEFFYPCCSPLSALEGTPRGLVATGDQEGAGWPHPPLYRTVDTADRAS